MDNYEVISPIGKGSFGVVSKIRRKSDNKILVWKELNYGNMSEREKHQLVSEVNILKQLRHPNIVQYYDRIIDKKETRIYIIMEYCEGGDIGSLLKASKKEKDYIAEDVIWKIFTQIILALNECHNCKTGKILHRDIKPANIFLDANKNIKLGDFGLARVLNEDSVFAQTHVGTPYYMSPEQIRESKYNEKSDIWSAGCLLYEMAALKPPFQANSHLSLAMKIKSGKFDRLPPRYSEDLQMVIRSMIEVNPEKRANVQNLLSLPHLEIRVREKMVREMYGGLKTREEELKKKMEEILRREDEIKKREEEIRIKKR
jgi:serine/threonine protein kinase